MAELQEERAELKRMLCADKNKRKNKKKERRIE